MASKEYIPTHDLGCCSQFDPASPICQNCGCSHIDIEEAIILQECQAFYTVFLQLEKQLAGSGLHNGKPSDNLPPLLSVPYMVNGAFASELALKYLLISSNVTFNMRKGHDLAYLFQLLPQTQKNILTASIKQDCNLNDAIFQDGLNSIADTFNKQRYQFSNYNQDLSTHIIFAPFVHTMCKFVLEI